MKEISECLGVGRGVTAIIGGGGKTSLMYALARELRERGSVLVCTTTKILRPSRLPVLEAPSPAALKAALREGPVCLGSPLPDGKLGAPALPFSELEALADFVLTEADGAKRLPVKAHAAWEPVIPAEARRTVLVVGADCFGMPIGRICHRPELFCERAQARPEDPVTPENLARVIRSEAYGNILYVNKAETRQALEAARLLSALTELPAVAGSLWKGEWQCLY